MLPPSESYRVIPRNHEDQSIAHGCGADSSEGGSEGGEHLSTGGTTVTILQGHLLSVMMNTIACSLSVSKAGSLE